jgi:hypothetical protein
MTGRLNGQRFVPVYSKTICTAGLPYGLNNSRKKWSEYIFPIRANNVFNLRPSLIRRGGRFSERFLGATTDSTGTI